MFPARIFHLHPQHPHLQKSAARTNIFQSNPCSYTQKTLPLQPIS